MKTLNKISLLAQLMSLTFLASSAAFSGTTSLGETAGIEPSPRANAMGDAYTATEDDVFGAYYNPAHISRNTSAGFTYWRGYADDSTGVMSVFLPKLLSGFNVGASLLYYTAGSIDLFGPSGKVSTVNAESDYMGMLTVSRELGPLSIGLNGKVLHTRLFETAGASALLFDGGVLWRTPYANFGAALQNVGERMNFGNEDEHIPVTYRAGAYRSFPLNGLTVNGAFDLLKTQDEPIYTRFGVELGYLNMFFLRTGYEFQNSLSKANELRFGAGFALSKFTFDYALVPYQNLGATHRFSLVYKFGGCSKDGEDAVPAVKSEVKPDAESKAEPKPETSKAEPKASETLPAAQPKPEPVVEQQPASEPVKTEAPSAQAQTIPAETLPASGNAAQPAAQPAAVPVPSQTVPAQTPVVPEQAPVLAPVDNPAVPVPVQTDPPPAE